MKYNYSCTLPYKDSTVESRLSQHNPISSFPAMGDRPVYAVVRHPYTRALSLYGYAINDAQFKSLFGTISFEEFWDIDISEWCGWSLRTNQHEFINDKTVWFKMEDSLEGLYKATKVTHYKRFINKSTTPYTPYFNDNNKSLVESMFKEDYHRFNYK